MIPRRAARAKKEPEIIRSSNTNSILSTFRGMYFRVKVSFVVFENPDDFPDAYIVREFYGDGEKKPTRYITISETLGEARETIPIEEMNLVSVPRQENESESIVETWIQEDD